MKKHESNGLPVSSIVGFLGLVVVMGAIAIGKETGVIENHVAKRGVGIIFGLMLIGVAISYLSSACSTRLVAIPRRLSPQSDLPVGYS